MTDTSLVPFSPVRSPALRLELCPLWRGLITARDDIGAELDALSANNRYVMIDGRGVDRYVILDSAYVEVCAALELYRRGRVDEIHASDVAAWSTR